VYIQLMEMKKPFSSGNNSKLRQLILENTHPPLSEDYSDSLRNVIDRMLTKVL
jgi:hypothetical protein